MRHTSAAQRSQFEPLLGLDFAAACCRIRTSKKATSHAALNVGFSETQPTTQLLSGASHFLLVLGTARLVSLRIAYEVGHGLLIDSPGSYAVRHNTVMHSHAKMRIAERDSLFSPNRRGQSDHIDAARAVLQGLSSACLLGPLSIT